MKEKVILLCVGYPSTGKTTSTQRLQFEFSQLRNVDLLTTLSIRHSLGLMDNLDSETDRQRVYSELVRLADTKLREGTEVLLLDGNFNSRKRREPVYELAKKYDAELILMECRVDDHDEIERRLNFRKKNTEAIANRAASQELYNLIKNDSDTLQDDALPSGRHPTHLEYYTDSQTVVIRHIEEGKEHHSQWIEEIRKGLLPGRVAKKPAAIEAIIFDIGGVIQALRWESVANRLTSIRSDLTMDQFRNSLYYEKEISFGLYEVGKLSSDEFWKTMTRRLELNPSRTVEVRESFKHLYGPIDTEMAGLLKSLKEKYRLFVLSNSCPELEDAIRNHSEFYEIFEKLYFSHRIGFKKPDKQTYRTILRENNLSAESCCFIDDVPRNIEAARELGLQGFLFVSPHRLKEDLKSLLP